MCAHVAFAYAHMLQDVEPGFAVDPMKASPALSVEHAHGLMGGRKYVVEIKLDGERLVVSAMMQISHPNFITLTLTDATIIACRCVIHDSSSLCGWITTSCALPAATNNLQHHTVSACCAAPNIPIDAPIITESRVKISLFMRWRAMTWMSSCIV